MNYKNALKWLNEIPISFNKDYKGYKLTLKKVHNLFNYLKNPEKKLKIIHIGGTNGKGSTSNIISSILQEHGKKIGVFSSPHILDVRERIKINDVYIPKDFFSKFISKHKKYFTKNKISFFEILFSMSISYFSKNKTDYVVLEVGLGGRLDATNICNPIISCITNIGFDHKKFLGNTLLSIATEKAGIIKPGIPVVIGEQRKNLINFFQNICCVRQTKMYSAGSLNEVNYDSDLKGIYQIKNISVAIKTVSLIKDIQIDYQLVKKGVKNVKKNTRFYGRWDLISHNPDVIIDVAHNVDGIKEILSQIKEYKNQIRIVFGTLDKIDQLKIINLFPKNYIYYFCNIDSERAMSVEKILEKARQNKLNFNSFNKSKNALGQAINDSSKNDVVFVIGSVYLISEILTQKS